MSVEVAAGSGSVWRSGVGHEWRTWGDGAAEESLLVPGNRRGSAGPMVAAVGVFFARKAGRDAGSTPSDGARV